MGISKKCQAAFEYMMIAGFVIMVLTPVIYLVYDYSNRYSRDIAVSQAYDVGSRIVDSAESIFYFGKPSRITLELNMPSNIVNMSIYIQNPDVYNCSMCTELRFYFDDRERTIVSIPSLIELRASEQYYASSERISHYNSSAFTPGLKRFKLIAYDDFVEIRHITGEE